MSAEPIPPARPIGEEVAVITTCLADVLRPDIGDAVRRLLRRHGHRPIPHRGATCCGQPAWNTGLTSAARRVARRTLGAVADTTAPVVVPLRFLRDDEGDGVDSLLSELSLRIFRQGWGVRSNWRTMFSKKLAKRRSCGWLIGSPMSCRPTVSPAASKPHGIEMAGHPVHLRSRGPRRSSLDGSVLKDTASPHRPLRSLLESAPAMTLTHVAP